MACRGRGDEGESQGKPAVRCREGKRAGWAHLQPPKCRYTPSFSQGGDAPWEARERQKPVPKGRSGELGLQPPNSCCLGRKVSVGSSGGGGVSSSLWSLWPSWAKPPPGPAEEGCGQGLPLQIWLYLPHTLKTIRPGPTSSPPSPISETLSFHPNQTFPPPGPYWERGQRAQP